MTREWKILPERDNAKLQNAFPSRLVRQLLLNRGIEDESAAQSFLSPDYARDLHDPFLFQDMEKAAARVTRALKDGEHIAIHGDYDADGVCASAIIASTLEFLGGKPSVYLPHRMKDGYGLKQQAVDTIAAQGATLLITADCGISNIDAITSAQSRGIDTIIVDHHHAPPVLPAAYAIIHCDREGERYPFRHLSAGGVAFKFAQALLRTARLTRLELTERNVEAFEKWLLDLVAISTVADVMPLIGENRALVHYGLHVLRQTKRPGLRMLIGRANSNRQYGNGDFTARTIGYQIAPRLNAAGRMEHASLAYDLLRADNEADAARLAELLETANSERQRVTDIMFEESIMQTGEGKSGTVMVTYGRDWSVGLVGLVAGKLADRFGKPAFVIGAMNGSWIGSCRGDGVFDCVTALESVADLLDHWGGHAQAAGFTLKEEIEPSQFAEVLQERNVAYAGIRPALLIDAVAGFGELDDAIVSMSSQLAPHGEGNPPVLLLTRGALVTRASFVGKSERHVKCALRDVAGIEKTAIAFGHADLDEPHLHEGARVDIVYEPAQNFWNGNSSLELYVRDTRKAE